jgi:hypothetical protein
MIPGRKLKENEVQDIKRKIVESLEKSTGGVFTSACKAANIGTCLAYRWRKEDAKFDADVKAAVEQATNTFLDMAETRLVEAVNQGKTAELIFSLKTKGKSRGYVERTETDHGVRDDSKAHITLSIGHKDIKDI